jgi:hypothetical protein
VHVLAALYLDYKPPPAPMPTSVADNLAQLQAHMPQMPDHMKLTPQWPTTRLLNTR